MHITYSERKIFCVMDLPDILIWFLVISITLSAFFYWANLRTAIWRYKYYSRIEKDRVGWLRDYKYMTEEREKVFKDHPRLRKYFKAEAQQEILDKSCNQDADR